MSIRYAYSYDREDYRGSFASADEALQTAIANAAEMSNPPTEMYVGELVDADPQSTDHAGPIIHAMRQRALVDIGDAARNYLKGVTRRQEQDLDIALSHTIRAWLERHGLLPNFVRVQGIREYPITYSVPNIARPTNGRPIIQFKIKEAEREEEWCCEGAD